MYIWKDTVLDTPYQDKVFHVRNVVNDVRHTVIVKDLSTRSRKKKGIKTGIVS